MFEGGDFNWPCKIAYRFSMKMMQSFSLKCVLTLRVKRMDNAYFVTLMANASNEVR